jgi:hypothetical protein
MRDHRMLRVLVVVAFVGIVGAAAYAFTAGNTVPASNAGAGSGAISGYTVSNIAYAPNASTPTNLDQVTFDLDAPATDVKVTLVNGGSVYDCGASAGASNTVTCATTSPQATVAAANNLTVVAVG